MSYHHLACFVDAKVCQHPTQIRSLWSTFHASLTQVHFNVPGIVCPIIFAKDSQTVVLKCDQFYRYATYSKLPVISFRKYVIPTLNVEVYKIHQIKFSLLHNSTWWNTRWMHSFDEKELTCVNVHNTLVFYTTLILNPCFWYTSPPLNIHQSGWNLSPFTVLSLVI